MTHFILFFFCFLSLLLLPSLPCPHSLLSFFLWSMYPFTVRVWWIFVLDFCEEKISYQCIFFLLMASVGYHLLSECCMPWRDPGVNEAGFHWVICPQLSGNSLGSLIEIKDCHLPHTLLVPGRRPGLFSLGKRISYISFRCLDFTLRLNYL